MADSKPVTEGVVTAAMAWRVKYRKTDDEGKVLRLKLPIASLGVHRKNRGGVYPAGVRCKSLCVEAMDVGFVKEEFCHAFVSVEEPPVENIRSRGDDFVSSLSYNVAACKKDELLDSCFIAPYDMVRYMSLSLIHI